MSWKEKAPFRMRIPGKVPLRKRASKQYDFLYPTFSWPLQRSWACQRSANSEGRRNDGRYGIASGHIFIFGSGSCRSVRIQVVRVSRGSGRGRIKERCFGRCQLLENRLVGISFVKGPAGTLGELESGAINAGKAAGAESVKITASMVKDSMARLLTSQGFTQEMKNGKASGKWIKTIVLKKPD
jgi:hypothetical protein